jgi:hypothetical protein
VTEPRPLVFLAEFDDGEIHACRRADDIEVVSRPMCGKSAVYRSKGESGTFVCDACIPLLAVELGLDPEEFLSRLQALKSGLDDPDGS